MTESEQKPCPICKLDQQDVVVEDHGKRLSVTCKRCGEFTITNTAAQAAEKKGISHKLSAWIRDRTDSGTEIQEITNNTLEAIEKSFRNYSVSEKQLILMRACERKTDFPGHVFSFDIDLDYPIVSATGKEEFYYLLVELSNRGLLELLAEYPHGNNPLQITSAGWAFLDEHARASVISDQGFVAMSFAEGMKPAWENGIHPAIKKAGFNPYRTDMRPDIDRIDLKIMTEIKNSRFLVADVTLQRPGVYFEAGYALGLGIPVFWCVRQDDLDNIHFDTRQYNHIVWKDEQDLADQLHVFITAIIGKGSAK